MNIRCRLLGHSYESREAKEHEYCNRCEFAHLDEPVGLLLPSTYWQMVADYVAQYYCQWRGHKWEDVSTAGPDSGNVTIECSRCGESHRTVLY